MVMYQGICFWINMKLVLKLTNWMFKLIWWSGDGKQTVTLSIAAFSLVQKNGFGHVYQLNDIAQIFSVNDSLFVDGCTHIYIYIYIYIYSIYIYIELVIWPLTVVYLPKICQPPLYVFGVLGAPWAIERQWFFSHRAESNPQKNHWLISLWKWSINKTQLKYLK